MPTIKLFANLRKIAGTKELSVTGSTVGEVLNDLVMQNPSLAGVILDDGHLRPHFVVTLNGQNVVDLNVSVSEPDVVAIFPPIAGGSADCPRLQRDLRQFAPQRRVL